MSYEVEALRRAIADKQRAETERDSLRAQLQSAREECERWRESARSLGRVQCPEDLYTVAAGLTETRAELQPAVDFICNPLGLALS